MTSEKELVVGCDGVARCIYAETWPVSCFLQADAWLAWMPTRGCRTGLASRAVVRSPVAAAGATLALNAAPKTRRFQAIILLLTGCLPPGKLHLSGRPKIGVHLT